MLPVMQSLLQHLLSKEVLYPSLKEITEKVRGGRRGTVTPPRDPWDPPRDPGDPLPSTPSGCGSRGWLCQRHRAQLGVMAQTPPGPPPGPLGPPDDPPRDLWDPP